MFFYYRMCSLTVECMKKIVTVVGVKGVAGDILDDLAR